jgi:hypothetical protein
MDDRGGYVGRKTLVAGGGKVFQRRFSTSWYGLGERLRMGILEQLLTVPRSIINQDVLDS